MALKNKKLKKKLGFKNIFNSCKVHIKCTFSNIFISLTDTHGRLIISCSSGSSGVQGSKRRKSAPQAVENIMAKLYPYMVLNRFKNVELVLRSRVSASVFYW